MKKNNCLILKTPGTDWRDGLPVGNGQIGAMIAGNVNKDRVLLNHDQVWMMGKSPETLPDLKEKIVELRELLKAGDYETANDFLPQAMQEGGREYCEPMYQPLGYLFIEQAFEDASREYQRILDMASGEACVSWKDGEKKYSKKLFVSRINGLVGLKIDCDKSGSIDATFTVGPIPIDDEKNHGKPYLEPFTEATTRIENGLIHYQSKELNDGSPACHPAKVYGAFAAVVSQGGERKETEDSICIKGADSITVWLKLYVGDNTDCPSALQQAGTYEDELAPHTKAHEEIFSRVNLDIADAEESSKTNEELLLAASGGVLPNALAERMFNYGRYLLMCSSSPNSLPANLQGVWNGDYMPPWRSFFMNNENVQMNYWQAFPGNLREMTDAYFKYFEERLDDFRNNSKMIFGCRGINIPAFSGDATGMNRALPAHCLIWTGAAGWLAALFYDYWLFTGDKDFLKNRALPFIKEVALFYEDFFIEDEDGKFISMPSNSPENAPKKHEFHIPGTMGGTGKRISIAINSTMDFAIAKEVLKNLISGYASLGEEPAELATWQEMLKKIPPYEINEDGALKEWLHPDFPDNYEHRHESHIYPVFPGFEISKDESPELFEACRVALDKRKVIGLKDQTGWSLAHMSNARARLGEGEKAHRALEIMAQTCIGMNFFTYHNDYRYMGPTVVGFSGARPPFQMDANFGWTAAMLEMFVFSKPGQIKVLPALPTAWPKGKVSNLCCRGGITISIDWDLNKKKVNIVLESKTDQTIDLVCPVTGTNEKVELLAGEKKKF